MPRRSAGMVAVAPALLLAGCANLHEVDPGRFYRSAQLDRDELEDVIARHGIRTIINLRGAEPGKTWYEDEAEVARSMGVELIDIPMSGRRLPHRRDLLRLLDAYREAERPLLVHCRRGADRTGEASAIYSMDCLGKTRQEALGMLDRRYRHWPVVYPAKRYFIREVYRGMDWAYRDYDPCRGEYLHYDREEHCQEDPAAAGRR